MTTAHALAPRIVLHGTAFNRGQAYGAAARDRIAQSLETYQRMFDAVDLSWPQAVARAEPFEQIIGNTFPVIVDELRGVASGSGVDFGSLLALNCRTELLPPNFLALASASSGAALPDGGHINECTSFAVAPGDANVLLAQNWDWIGPQRDALVVLEQHPDQGLAHLTVAEAGMMAKIGFNERGLGVTLNILRSQDDGSRAGMPVHALLRGLLDCQDVDEATELALGLSYAGSSNIMIADPQGRIASLECSPRGAVALPARREGARASLCHTNHFCDATLGKHEANLAGNLSTTERLNRAHELIDSVVDVPSAGQLLSDTSDGMQSICRFPDPEMPLAGRIETVVSTILDLSARELHLSAAQPSITPYQRIALEAQAVGADD